MNSLMSDTIRFEFYENVVSARIEIIISFTKRIIWIIILLRSLILYNNISNQISNEPKCSDLYRLRIEVKVFASMVA